MGDKKRPKRMTKAQLERRVAKLERALRWYADSENWRPDDWGVVSVVQPPEYGRPGNRARRALGLRVLE